jgi:hypothetical protein
MQRHRRQVGECAHQQRGLSFKTSLGIVIVSCCKQFRWQRDLVIEFDRLREGQPV